MPSANRRLPRALRTPIPSLIPGFTGELTDQVLAPKHFPFPNTPISDDLFFELLLFVFVTICGGLQFLHLYRTVWWLPHSYTKHAVNFYLIDIYLVSFIIILLSRRLVYIVGCRILDKFINLKFVDYSLTCYRLSLFGLISSLLALCAHKVIQNHPFVNILYLCYPVLVYLILFGCQITPFLETVTWNGSYLPPLHACRINAPEIREEVETLKTNFNHRVKQILFNSVINAYYAGFVPCCFAQNQLHYDVYWASQHVIFIFMSSFVASASHTISLRYCDILHRSALHLGSWCKLENRNMILVNNNWSEESLWPYGALVKHGKDLYRAQGECNASEPGNPTYSRFYFLFRNPSNSFCLLLLWHGFVVVVQLGLLFYVKVWYRVISMTFILFFNYYVLYKLLRDCTISLKMYDEEKIMQHKVALR